MKDNLEILHDRYARALFECAEADGAADKVMEELEVLNAEWLQDREFNRFLTHALIAPHERKTVIEKLMRKKGCSDTTINFLKVLIDNRREELIHAVFLRYRDLYEESKNEIRFYVEIPRPFTREERGFLEEALKSKFLARAGRGEINLDVKENPDLLSGIFIRYKDRIYDCSIRSQLNSLKRGLMR